MDDSNQKDLMEQQRDRGVIARLTARAWIDPVFKERLLADPASHMRQAGLAIPPGVTVKMHENTATLQHIVLPHKPDDLTAEEANDPERVIPMATDYWILFKRT